MNRAFLFSSFVLTLVANLRADQNGTNTFIARHSKDLVVLKGEDLVPADADRFSEAACTILYFGAGWCPDCRRFSPALVEAYDHQASGVARFEVLLISRDKNAEGMLKFMKTEKMKWPALAFDKIATADDLNRFYSGRGIPCLTVVDGSGKVLLQSKDDQDANEILQQLQGLLRTPQKK